MLAGRGPLLSRRDRREFPTRPWPPMEFRLDVEFDVSRWCFPYSSSRTLTMVPVRGAPGVRDAADRLAGHRRQSTRAVSPVVSPMTHRPINRAGSNRNGASGDQRDSTISVTRRVEQAPPGVLMPSSRARFVVVRTRQPPPSGSACPVVGLGKHHIAWAAAPGGEQQRRRQDLQDDWSSSNRRAVSVGVGARRRAGRVSYIALYHIHKRNPGSSHAHRVMCSDPNARSISFHFCHATRPR